MIQPAKLLRRARLKLGLTFSPREDRLCRELAETYRVGKGYSRIYFYHVRKTGGTSLNQMFLGLDGRSGGELFRRLARSTNLRIVAGDKVFVGWNKSLIEQGHYFYAFSHHPHHQLRIPSNTFTFTCLRHPIERVLSYYKMLLSFRDSDSYPKVYERSLKWMGNSFVDFLEQTPSRWLQAQLYMFSEELVVDEAYDSINQLSYYLLTEDFDRGVRSLSQKIGLPLEPIHTHRSTVAFSPSCSDVQRMHAILEPELVLYRRLQASRQKATLQLPASNQGD